MGRKKKHAEDEILDPQPDESVVEDMVVEEKQPEVEQPVDPPPVAEPVTETTSDPGTTIVVEIQPQEKPKVEESSNLTASEALRLKKQ